MRLVAIGYLVLAGWYATTIPPGKGADETAHVRYITWLAERHTLPVFSRESPGPDYEFHQPPLYYLLSLPTYLATSSSEANAAQPVRLVNILVGLALPYLTFVLARILAPNRPWTALAAAAVVAFLPMHLALAASISNDILTEVFFAAVLVLMALYLGAAARYRDSHTKTPPGGLIMACLGVMIGLCVLTKLPGILLFPAAWAAAALGARARGGLDWRRLIRDLSTGVALALSGWWLWRNQTLYGDLLAQEAFLRAFVDRPSPQEVMRGYQISAAGFLVTMVAPFLVTTSLGAFGPLRGNMFAFFPAWVYALFAVKALAEGVGFIRYVTRTTLSGWRRQVWAISAFLALLLLASFVRFNLSFFQAQARYLFPALPPVAVALCLGLEHLAPERLRLAFLAMGVGLLLLLATGGYHLWIAPQFQVAAHGGRP